MTSLDGEQGQSNFGRIVLVTLAGILILGGITFAAYKFSQKKASNMTLPGGVTYLGPTPQTGNQQPTAPQLFTVDSNTAWLTRYGETYPVSFSYPVTLPLVVYSGDNTDTVSIGWGNIPPQQNVLINMGFVSELDVKYINLPKEEYVKNWWKSFGGLKGLKSMTPFTNAQGLKGYRARYVDWSDSAPIENVFFEVPADSKIMIHLANGVLEESVFDRIVHSVAWGAPTPTPTQQ